MTDRGSEPKAPLRPMAPPFGGLRASRPLTRPSGTPSLGATPIAQRAVTPMSAPIAAPPRPPTPFASPTVDPAAPSLDMSDANPGVAESSADAQPTDPTMPGIADFLSFVEPDESDVETLAVPRFTESELAKSTQGDPLFERTAPSVAETMPEAGGAYVDEALPPAGLHAEPVESEPLADLRNAVTDVNGDAPALRAEDPNAVPWSTVASSEPAPAGDAWNEEPWPADPGHAPAVAARSTPHDVAAVRVDDDDPFFWDAPSAYAMNAATVDGRDGGELDAADAGSNPFAALSEPPFAAVDGPPTAHFDAVRAAGTEPRIDAADANERDFDHAADPDSFGAQAAAVYEPDDATSWAATSTPGHGTKRIAEGAGRHAAAVLEHLAEDVRSGRLRIDGAPNASAAGVLASLLATLLAPQRQG